MLRSKTSNFKTFSVRKNWESPKAQSINGLTQWYDSALRRQHRLRQKRIKMAFLIFACVALIVVSATEGKLVSLEKGQRNEVSFGLLRPAELFRFHFFSWSVWGSWSVFGAEWYYAWNYFRKSGFLFIQMAPSRILCDQKYWSCDFFNVFFIFSLFF